MRTSRRRSGDDRPHVLILLENLPVQRDQRVRREARALVEAGYRVSVICPADRDRTPAALPGVRVLAYPPPPESGSKVGFVVEYAWSWLAAAALTVALFARQRFHAIQACNPPEIYFTLAAPFRLLGAPFVFDHHDLSPELYAARYGEQGGVLPALLRLLERGTLRTADHVIATNDSVRQVALTRGHKSASAVTVVRNGPELRTIGARSRRSDLSAGRPLLCCWLGVVGVDDGVDLAVTAVHHLVHVLGRRDCHFVFLGDGERFAASQRLARELRVEDWVSFPGWVSQEVAFDFLASADLAIAPDPKNPRSDAATLMKVMEYMAFGLPIVSFDVAETRVSAGDAALYVADDGAPAFAHALHGLLGDPERRAAMGRLGRRRVEDQLAWDHQRSAYVGVFDHLLGRRS